MELILNVEAPGGFVEFREKLTGTLGFLASPLVWLTRDELE